MQLKTFSKHNKAGNSHDVSRKRFNAHAETGRELFHIQNTKQALAGVVPLEVRCAHPVRLSPDTHSQGHGRPCLQLHHPHQDLSITLHFGIVHTRWPFSGGHYRCAPFPNNIPEYLSRIPLHMAFPECSFQIVIPGELSRWPFHDTCFHVLNF